MLSYTCLISFFVIITVNFAWSKEISDDETFLSISARITNGVNANSAEFPYNAAIEVADIYSCGSSIIRANAVLTAAHCISKYPAMLLKIRAGTGIVLDTKGQNVQMRLAKKIVNHPRYNITAYNDNDISIVFLKTPFYLNNFVNVINLLDRKYDGNDAVIIVWGADENFKEVKNLKRGNTEIISNKQCASLSLPRYKITENMICALSKNRRQTICNGDSGGPLVIHDSKNHENDILVGITSYGRIINSSLKRFCDTKNPAVFANVFAKRNWILSELDKYPK